MREFRVLRAGAAALAFAAALGGCAGGQTARSPLDQTIDLVLSLPGRVLTGSQPNESANRPAAGEAAAARGGAPSVKDFLAACDLMARDLAMSAAVQTAREPVVVEIKPIENKTDARIDLTIYPQTIRGMILKQGSNRVAFRDETARRDIVLERSHQNDEPVTVEHERTVEEKSAVAAAGAAAAKSAGDDSRTTLKKSSDVSGRLAETDYFLNGFIYAVDEAPDEPGAAALRYFRFQFRLTDARSGLVVWENDYEVKKAGALAAAR